MYISVSLQFYFNELKRVTNIYVIFYIKVQFHCINTWIKNLSLTAFLSFNICIFNWQQTSKDEIKHHVDIQSMYCLCFNSYESFWAKSKSKSSVWFPSFYFWLLFAIQLAELCDKFQHSMICFPKFMLQKLKCFLFAYENNMQF